MNTYKVIYKNYNTGNTSFTFVKGLSLASVQLAEEKAMVMFARINPALSFLSVEAVA